ncbi:TPA: hypothetical protein R3V32_004492 [Enterobacter cloacae]|uniref:hypothetical protein n=1 Tax=Enterobacter cloacae TaxID=550 RepID=UPI0021D2B19B|nr:hypothetical protein [Enterobacter cloacae]MCU6281807.1 hypothetical protein [Enterobacter cloacae]HEC5282980.1 hypothetical protein [Enterobacter cloacae]
MKENRSSEILFPEVITYSFDYQQKHLWRCRYTSIGSKSLHYKMLLPLSVKPVNIEPEPIKGLHGFYSIGRYQTVSESEFPFMETEVVYEYITNDIDASDWLDYILLLLEEEVIHRKDYYSVGGKYSDVLTKNNSDGKVVISRIRVFKNYDFERKGANLILVKASCPLVSYESLAEYLLHCVKFFTLINDSGWHLAEELKSININSPTSHSFYYPASWQYTERYNNKKMSYHSLFLKQENKTNGIIDSYFLCQDVAIEKEQICQLIFSELKEKGYSEIEPPLLKEIKIIFNKNIAELWTWEIKVNDAKNRECILVVFAGKVQKNWFYVIGTLKSKKQDFKLSTAGKRAIDIVLNSLNNYELVYEEKFYEEQVT